MQIRLLFRLLLFYIFVYLSLGDIIMSPIKNTEMIMEMLHRSVKGTKEVEVIDSSGVIVFELCIDFRYFDRTSFPSDNHYSPL
jgi:hypothetical protein